MIEELGKVDYILIIKKLSYLFHKTKKKIIQKYIGKISILKMYWPISSKILKAIIIEQVKALLNLIFQE